MTQPEFTSNDLESLQEIRQIDGMWWRVGAYTRSLQPGSADTFRLPMEELTDLEPQEAEWTGGKESVGIVVEQIHVGSTGVTAVMCSHIPENAAGIAEQLQDCDVIAIENVGLRDDNERRDHEQLYTLLVSSQVNPDALDRAFAELGRNSSFMAEVLKPLRGTDKQVVLLDVNRDHPQCYLVQNAEQARVRLVEAVVDRAALEEAESAINDSVRFSAAVWPARDKVQSEQLKTLINHTNNTKPGTKVGVVVGITHHDAIAALSPTGLNSGTKEQLEHNKSLYDRAISAAAEKSPNAELLKDRALLSAYLMVYVFGPENAKHSDEFASKLDESRLREVLSVLGAYLSNSSATAQRKANDTKHYLKAVVDLLSES